MSRESKYFEAQEDAISEYYSVNFDVESGSDEKQQAGLQSSDNDIVDFEGPNDPSHPMTWPSSRKWGITLSLSLMTFTVSFGSSVISAGAMPMSIEFNVSVEVMALSVSLYVLGFAFGPIVWGPLSEEFGRKTPLFAAYLCFALFNIPVAVAHNLQQLFICRFFAGLFASAPLAICGGAITDLFNPIQRGTALGGFCAATFLGPAMGPIIGGFVTMSHLGWRWTQWLTLIMAALFGTIGFFVVPETSTRTILQRKARRLRFQTKNWALHATADEERIDLRAVADRVILRPFRMIVLEPILMLVTVYMSLIYGIIYGFFEAFPIAFQEERGYNLGVAALPFLSLMIGFIVGCAVIGVFTKARLRHILEAGEELKPEDRLIPMIGGGVLMPAGLFWFAWTSNPSINPWPQIISSVPIGMGTMMIFVQGIAYITDVFTINANSAIAANTFLRSGVAAAFPLFSIPMFHNLGVPWAMSLLAFLNVALLPVPILFYIYGPKLRQLSRFTRE